MRPCSHQLYLVISTIWVLVLAECQKLENLTKDIFLKGFKQDSHYSALQNTGADIDSFGETDTGSTIDVTSSTRVSRDCNVLGMELVNVVDIHPDILVDLTYNSNNNFLDTNLYEDFSDCLLREKIACKLARAQDLLSSLKPGYRLICFDCLRPRSVQHRMWDFVKGTSQQSYVANPYHGSIHNYGAAVDLSIVDETGKLLDMGTDFDDFSELSHPNMEHMHLSKGNLTADQIANRLLLRMVMVKSGFLGIGNEWWHFNGDTRKNIRETYDIVE